MKFTTTLCLATTFAMPISGCRTAASQPASSPAKLDLSTPRAAALTHWQQRHTSDPATIRAQYWASTPTQARALAAWADMLATFADLDAAILQRYGQAAFRGPDALLPPDADQKVYTSLNWQVTGDTALPVHPTSDAGERKLVHVNGEWLQPISVWMSDDPDAVAEISKDVPAVHELAGNIRAGKYKDVAATKEALSKALTPPANPPEAHLLLPARLPDTNPTLPGGALGAFAMAVVTRDRKTVNASLVSADEPERAVTQATLDWIDADMELNEAVEKKFGVAVATDFWGTSGLNTPTLIAYAILRRLDEAQVQMKPGGQRATVGVPGALAWEMREIGDRWQVSIRDSVAADLSQMFGRPPAVPPDLAASLMRVAGVERKAARDTVPKLAKIDDLKDALSEGMAPAADTAATQPAARP